MSRAAALAIAGLAVLAWVPARAGAPAMPWEKSLDAAVKRARSSRRGLLILFTSEYVHKTTRRCRFTHARVRQAAARSGVVCARVLRPQKPDATTLLMGGNANVGPVLQLAQKEYQKRLGAYNAKARRYRVTGLPCVVLAYPDGKVFRRMHAPRDETIIRALRELARSSLAAVRRPREEERTAPEEKAPARLEPAAPEKAEPAPSDPERMELAARVDPFETGLDPEDF